MLPARLAKVDFHLHSHASNVTDYYAANVFSIPESYSEPKKLHALLKSRGMDLVTLTDHNSIDGVKELLDAGLPDVFTSSELTVTFPEDGGRIHLTVANVSEAQFAEAMRLRGNVYHLLAWLDDEVVAGAPIAYFMTHPLMSTQNRPYGRDGALRIEHIEKMLLLCPAFEVQNGTRTKALNDLTGALVRSLDRARIEQLANKHGIAPRGAAPWQKAVLGGSDDHAGINPGRTWTTFPFLGERPTVAGLVDCIRHGETRPGGAHGGPITLAHALLKLVYDGSQRRAVTPARGLGLPPSAQSLMRLVFASDAESPLDRITFQARALLHSWFGPWRRGPLAGRSFEEILDEQVLALLASTGFRQQLAAAEGTDERIFLVLNALVSGVFSTYFDNLRSACGGNVVLAIKEFVALVASNLFVSAPYLLAYLQQSSDCLIARDARERFALGEAERIVLVTDTFFEINGVTGTIRRMLREAPRRGRDLTVVTCVTDPERARALSDPEAAAWVADGRLRLLPALRTLDFPEYEGLAVRFPPLLDLLRLVQEGGYTKMQISTPGTLGLLGLLVAKILQIETASTYHTSFPEYVENYTGDVTLEATAWRYMILFYHAVDEVIVPSKYVAKLLHKRGLRKRKLLILDRWVDTERFHPRHRRTDFWRRWTPPEHGAVVRFLYVGRLGVEKNLRLVADAFRKVAASHPEARLVLVGDGPYRKELETQLAGLAVLFTGFLEGEELAAAIASADVKVFASMTDTWGNAPLEAQASGLPVIVSSVGGPQELMVDGQTGLVVSGRDADGLARAMVALLDETTRSRMGAAARAFTEQNRVPEPYTAILDSAAYRESLKAGEHPSRAVVRLPVDADGEVVDGMLA
jgi:glycosyltransferase involved in cell wall biosynthesis